MNKYLTREQLVATGWCKKPPFMNNDENILYNTHPPA
jgi:hypothetical protein